MDNSARAVLMDLMTRSKKGLSFAEQLCTQAREELDACQNHSDDIEKIYSKLSFVSRQIKIQLSTVESLLRIGRARLIELAAASKELQQDLNNASLRMEHALRALRNKQVDSEIQKARQGEGNTSSISTSLYDFLDEARLQSLLEESRQRIQRVLSTTDHLQELVDFFSTQRIEYKGYLANAIQLDETALNSARDKMLLQEHQTTSMADMLVSLANHYDQVAKVLTDDIQPMHEDLTVLVSDTEEMQVVIEELEDSLTIVQATSEEIGVQEQQYSTAYREAITFFKKIEAFEPELAQLVQIFKVSETLNEDFEVTEKLTDEIISLAIWYEEFHNSYGALTVEIVRRHKAHESRQRLVKEFIDKMEASYADDMHSRGEFSDLHGKYLPVDLCPAFADLPVQYEVVSHGEWLLPMPTRATLKLVEEIEKAATK